MLDLLGRQKPDVFANYIIGSILRNCYITLKPARLFGMLKENEYILQRTGEIRFYDSSKKRIGQ